MTNLFNRVMTEYYALSCLDQWQYFLSTTDEEELVKVSLGMNYLHIICSAGLHQFLKLLLDDSKFSRNMLMVKSLTPDAGFSVLEILIYAYAGSSWQLPYETETR